MPAENNEDGNNGETNNTSPANQSTPPNVAPEVLEALIQERLQPIKEKLDNAFRARDAAIQEAEELKRKEREREVERLQREGKQAEALEIQLKEEKAAREALERQNTELTRNMKLREVLSTFKFKNANAMDMAFNMIVPQLIRNEAGDWIHASGIQIKDYVKNFSENDEYSFLFHQKVSSGAGSSPAAPANTSGKPTSLFALPQEQVLKLAAEGKIPRRR